MTLPVNLFETSDSYVMHVALPGINPDKLDIQVKGRDVTIKGNFEINTPENGTWIWQGIPTGEFFESYTLPLEVQGDSVQASYDFGILTLGLPKAEQHRTKSIKMQVHK
jgi:HSP20 family protein